MGGRSVVRPGSGADRWFELKSQVHQKLVNSLTPDQLKNLSKDSVRGQVGTVVENWAPGVYEVEFADDSGKTYAMVALKADRLMRLHHEPVHQAA